MARQNSRTQRAQAGARTWDAAHRPAGVSFPDGVTDATGRLRETISTWATAEVTPGRLMPWLPVAFGFGIVVYFNLAKFMLAEVLAAAAAAHGH